MKRHDGIDALRIVSMFMVVVLHTLGHGGILHQTDPFSSHYYVAWFLETACFCAVNCFALISGFVLYRSKPTISRLMQLWLQVVFYTVLITVIFALISPEEFTWKYLVRAVFPVVTCQYWYISAYFGLYMLAPLLNAAIQNISKPSFDLTLIGLFVVFVLIATPLLHDPLVLNVGYSAIWLCLLYVVGAYIHKYDIPSKFKKRQALGIFMMMVLITFASKIVCRFFNITLFENILVSYTSPTILLSGISLFIAFAKMNDIRPLQKVIRVLAPASLGVYLVHEHPIIRKHLISGFSANFVSHNFIVMILLVIGASCGIYLLCSAIDLVRIKLFSLLRIKDLCNKIESFIMKRYQSSEVVNSK